MSRIEACFEKLGREKQGALIVFTVAGHPTPALSSELLLAIVDSGADIVELGIPFSDPVADGPAIQAASQRALGQQMTPGRVLELAAGLRAARDVPLVLMTCYNPICQFGLQKFAADGAAAGVDGMIITDLPPEEADDWTRVARERGIDAVFLLSPNSPDARVKKVVDLTSGFVYCVSRMGVTGARPELPPDLAELVARIRRETVKPIAVGFGVSRPEHVAEVCRIANGAVVGSAVVSLIDEQAGPAGLAEMIGAFVRELKAATRSGRVAELDPR